MISATRSMFAVCVASLLCLMPLSLSAPLSCEDLIRPQDKLVPHHLEGRWALVAGSVSDPKLLEIFKNRDSATVDFSNGNKTSHLSYARSLRFDGKCVNGSYNISLEGSSFSYERTDKSNLNGTFIYTSCHDCILMRFNVESGKRIHLYFFSRRREVDQREMEEYTAQVACLQMPPPVVMDPSKELCPELSVTEPAAEMKEETDS